MKMNLGNFLVVNPPRCGLEEVHSNFHVLLQQEVLDQQEEVLDLEGMSEVLFLEEGKKH